MQDLVEFASVLRISGGDFDLRGVSATCWPLGTDAKADTLHGMHSLVGFSEGCISSLMVSGVIVFRVWGW